MVRVRISRHLAFVDHDQFLERLRVSHHDHRADIHLDRRVVTEHEIIERLFIDPRTFFQTRLVREDLSFIRIDAIQLR